jgi:hypothetical protein
MENFININLKKIKIKNMENSNKIVDLRNKDINKAEENKENNNLKKNLEDKNEEQTKEILSWSALDFENDENRARWLKLAALGSLLVFIGALWTKNFIAAITFFLLSFVIFTNFRAKVKEIEIILTSKGIIAGEHNYFFDDLESFWITEEKNQAIVLKSKKFFMPYDEIYLNGQDPDKIREILKKYLKEKQEEKSFLKNNYNNRFPPKFISHSDAGRE